jgi:hypothetical protein
LRKASQAGVPVRRRRSRTPAPPALLWLLAGTLAVGWGCAAGPPEDEVAAEIGTIDPTAERPMSSLELIDAAMSSGVLEYSTGLLYKVYAMFEPESLPPEYQSDVPSKCGTPIISEVQRNWSMLSPEDRAEIAQYIEPIGVRGDEGTQLDDVTPKRLEDEREKLD